jgi:hypothetical protein
MRRFVRALCGLVLCHTLFAAAPAWAHPAPFSYLDIVLKDRGFEGTLVIHVIDAAHDLGITPFERLMESAVAEANRHKIADLLTPRLMLRTDRRLTIQWTSLEVLREDMALRLKYRIQAEPAGSLAVDTNLFPYDPLHQTFVNIYEEGSLRQQLIFNEGTKEYVYYAGTTQGALAVMNTFIPSGIHHIMIGPDHILFLVGLLLLGGSWMTLLRIVTAFTIGHSITLSLAALEPNWSPPATIVEPAIALSIVFVGADNLVRGQGRDLRAWVALVFGLVHGFGFANVLREFGLPREALGWSLFSFNFGVELGQVAIVLVVASLLAAVRKRNEQIGTRVAIAGSVVVIAAGTYWFVERVFFPEGII